MAPELKEGLRVLDARDFPIGVVSCLGADRFGVETESGIFWLSEDLIFTINAGHTVSLQCNRGSLERYAIPPPGAMAPATARDAGSA